MRFSEVLRMAKKTLQLIAGEFDREERVDGDGDAQFRVLEPYIAHVTVRGTKPIFFDAWHVEPGDPERKKGQHVALDLERAVYRVPGTNQLAVPQTQLRSSVIQAAKYHKDPRSPRASAMSLYTDALSCPEEWASFGVDGWDFVDSRRIPVMPHGAINKLRPGLLAGWQVTFQMEVGLPEYIRPEDLNAMVQLAGRLKGIGAARKLGYGRFQVVGFSAEAPEEAKPSKKK